MIIWIIIVIILLGFGYLLSGRSEIGRVTVLTQDNVEDLFPTCPDQMEVLDEFFAENPSCKVICGDDTLEVNNGEVVDADGTRPSLFFQLEEGVNGVEINTNCDCKVNMDTDGNESSICNCNEFPSLISGSGQLELMASFPSGTTRVKLQAVPPLPFISNLSDIVPRPSQTSEKLSISYSIPNNLMAGYVKEIKIQLYLNGSEEPSAGVPLIIGKKLGTNPNANTNILNVVP
jgi:hypothetical protein